MPETSPYSYPLLDTKVHDRAAFSCGEPSLDDYLKRRASQDVKRRAAIAYIMTTKIEPETIIGYYTLSAVSINLDVIPPQTAKKLPRYPDVSATLLGRLAVDERYKGRGHGGRLLRHALKNSFAQSEAIASAMVVVDALNDSAKQFYERYDFQPLTNDPMKLYIRTDTIKQAMSLK